MQGMDDAKLKLNLIFCPVIKGTLWRVAENVWKNQLGRGYDQKSNRPEHQGLSILETPPANNNVKVPLLHGRSAKGPIRIANTSPDGKATHFGHLLRPARLNIAKLHEKINKLGPIGIENGDFVKDRTLGHWSQSFEVIPNDHKKTLIPSELVHLEKFLKSKSRK